MKGGGERERVGFKKMKRGENAKRPVVVSIDSPGQFWSQAAGGGSAWMPSIVSPYPTNNGCCDWPVFVWWFHIVLWVMVTIFSIVANGLAFELQKRDPTCVSGMDSCFAAEPPVFRLVVGVVGAAFTLFTVLSILVSGMLLNEAPNNYSEWYVPTFICNAISIVSTSWVFIGTASQTQTVAHGMSLTTLLLHIFASSLLYTCAGALKLPNIPRIMVGSLAFATSLLVAIGVHTNDISLGDYWDTGLPIPFSYGQKFISWMVVISHVAAFLSILVGVWLITWDDVNQVSMDERPLLRSLHVTMYSIATICALYTHSFVSKDIDMASGMLSLASFVLTLLTTALVCAPDGVAQPSFAPADKKPAA